jgi:NAD(P)H-dependent flavin oxidoreductase YrpB (nitropropane dioxygenase family)
MGKSLEPLVVGGLELKVPIVQGGMGINVSTASLAAAVAECGGAGTIASVGLGYSAEENEADFLKASREGLEREIRSARERTRGVVGVNVIVALGNHDDLVQTCVREKADFIVSGAGLPLRLPELTDGSPIRLIPIVSSARAAAIILKTWRKRHGRLPDAIVVEGPRAGGHLGFRPEDLHPYSDKGDSLERLVTEVLKVARDYGGGVTGRVPVIAAGGIFDGSDVARFLRLGASGVQMGTRFVATHECAVPDAFKNLYVASGEDDLVIIKSPIGMPGRAIRTKFIDRVMSGEEVPFKCSYLCLKACDPKAARYCIAQALFNAVKGDLDNAVVFAGSNVPRVKEIVSVRELLDGIVREANAALEQQPALG